MAVTGYTSGSDTPGYLSGVRWNRAFQASLIVGAILFLLSRGIPWVGSGEINPAVMGRDIAPGSSPSAELFFEVIVLHFVLAVIYGFIIAPIVHGFRPWIAGAVGGVIGLILYFINAAVAGAFIEAAAGHSEWPAIIQHVIFGIVFAETYKGMVRRRRVETVEPL